MKKFLKNFLIPLLGFIILGAAVTAPISAKLDISPIILPMVLVGVALALHIISPSKRGHLQLNGVEVEVWANYIVERFWKDNAFMTRAFSDDDKVLAGRIVHIPQPGTLPIVVKNRTMLPSSIVRRADNDVTYLLDEYSTDTTVITQADKIELSYDKINSVYGDHAGVISQGVANDMIIKWLSGIPGSSIIMSTGANTSELGNSNFTGQRKVTVHQDLRKFQRMFNANNVPQEGRTAMYPAYMLDQFVDSLSNTQYRDFSQYYDAKEGVIGRLYGFDILMRSDVATVNSVDTTPTVNPYGSIAGAADSECALIWQKDAVARALGEVKFFENLDRAEVQGDLYSAYLRAGGRRRRADNLGVGMIVQATGS